MTEQRTDEWFAERCGKVTASRIADVMAKTKTGWGASRANYMAELIAVDVGHVDQVGLPAHRAAIGAGHAMEAGGLEQVRIGIADVEGPGGDRAS